MIRRVAIVGLALLLAGWCTWSLVTHRASEALLQEVEESLPQLRNLVRTAPVDPSGLAWVCKQPRSLGIEGLVVAIVRTGHLGRFGYFRFSCDIPGFVLVSESGTFPDEFTRDTGLTAGDCREVGDGTWIRVRWSRD